MILQSWHPSSFPAEGAGFRSLGENVRAVPLGPKASSPVSRCPLVVGVRVGIWTHGLAAPASWLIRLSEGGKGKHSHQLC